MAVSPRKKAYANASTTDLCSPSPGPSTPRQFIAIETSSLCTPYSSDNNTVVGDTAMFDLTKQVQAFSDKSPRYIPLDLNSSRHNIPPLEHNLIPFQGWAGAERHNIVVLQM
ncbi:hypothetical protein K443DRAFT_156050 [Laccaria amethystina LaAM-08-1]|uniref:Uncharacterized protein n=1 Tax=Laccaria amethystina LaAM-08-1 TaxID=1095629 RepID=A0A0C9WPK3_9AGAR|nr:hypothetical protein K443DRAFT_156050 [Laccaria amethystina LaAM-08-1]